jgi:WD40 repeat protein
VRESQVRLILQPIALELCKTFRSTASLEQQVLRILIELRRSETQASGYGAGNLINLCAHLKFDLTGFNFANLTIRHAYLQKVTLHRVHFAHANFIQSIFTQTFGSVLSIAFDVNGMQLATGSTDGSVCLWGTADGQPISVLKGHTNWVRCVQFSPAQAPELQRHSGELLASASQDRTIRLWNPQTGQCLNTLRGHTAWVWSISWSPDGQTLASGSYQIMECSNWRLPQNLAGAYQHGILSRLE